MIGYFADPYPDEIFWSALARTYSRLQYSTLSAFQYDYFGKKFYEAGFFIPLGLKYFVDSLPANLQEQYPIRKILNRHSLLPFYRPFSLPSRVREFEDDIVHRGQGKLATVMPVRYLSVQYIRWCPLCFEEDIEQYGEAYWHRSHQIGGIDICPHHYIWLKSSQIDLRDTNRTLIPASEVLSFENYVGVEDGTEGEILKELARSACWLLDQEDLYRGPEWLFNQYRVAMHPAGYTLHSGKKIRISKLLNDFYSQFPDKLIRLLELDVKSTIFHRFVRNKSSVYPPVWYLLLMEFLGYKVEDFMHEFEQEYFGMPSFPCLNPACNHYKEMVISDYKLDYNHKGLPRGRFVCEHCGFTYTRLGPDREKQKVYDASCIIERGDVWRDALKQYWLNPDVTLRAMSRLLKTSGHVLKRNATELGLPFPRPGANTHFAKTMTPVIVEVVERNLEAKRPLMRRKWLRLREENPDATFTKLRNLDLSTHYWLNRYDKTWLMDNSPELEANGGSEVFVDWEKRDLEYKNLVYKQYAVLRNEEGRPNRISKARLLRKIPKQATVILREIRAGLLPITQEALEDLEETYKQCAIRRLYWTENYFHKHPEKFRYPEDLIKMASIRAYLDDSEIRSLVDQSLLRLQGRDSQADA